MEWKRIWEGPGRIYSHVGLLPGRTVKGSRSHCEEVYWVLQRRYGQRSQIESLLLQEVQ